MLTLTKQSNKIKFMYKYNVNKTTNKFILLKVIRITGMYAPSWQPLWYGITSLYKYKFF